jgi:hypothetical protein
MNRVILGGQLVGEPRLAYLPCRMAIARLRLRAVRPRRDGLGDAVMDEIDCFAFRDLAEALALWGAAGVPVSLEGRLIPGMLLDECERPLRGCHVWIDRACALAPLPDPPPSLAALPNGASAPEQGPGEIA